MRHPIASLFPTSHKGSVRSMSHIIRALGEAALTFRKAGGSKCLPPIISKRRALEIRKQWLAEGK